LNLGIWKSLEKTLESKKFNFIFEFFVKILDGSNFDKKALLEALLRTFYRIEKFRNLARLFFEIRSRTF
jgi:hypothetical protein